MRIILYQAHQYTIGGVESFNKNFCKQLSKYYDVAFVYDSGDAKQIADISKYVPTYQFDGQYFECDVCIYSSAWGKRPEEYIKADRYIQMIHADFSALKDKFDFKYAKKPKVTDHIGGGINIAKTFKERYGYDCKVIHYLLDDEVKVQPVLRLITLSRIGKEKGFERMYKLAKALKDNDKKFIWDIWGIPLDYAYGEKIKKLFSTIPEVSFHGVGYELSSYVADADYLVQLSDTEGYSFAIYEALSLNTPVIATDFPNAREQIEDGKSGYILDMDLKNLDIDKLYKIPKFKFKPIADVQNWIDELGTPEKKGEKFVVKEPERIKVKIVRTYTDLQLNRKVQSNTILEVSNDRAKVLISKGYAVML